MVMLEMDHTGAQISTFQVLLVSAMLVAKKFDLVLEMNLDLSIMMAPVTHHLGLILPDRKERVSSTPSG